MTNIKKVKISDLIPDDNNANLGTERGRAMIEKSIQELGFGRSLVVDRNGKIIAGNKSHEVAGAVGLEDVLVVETDGSQVVAIMRTDLDLDKDAKAKQLAVVDNRSSEVSLKWDAEVLLELDQTIDLSAYFTDDEFNDLSLTINQEMPDFKPVEEDEQGKLDEKQQKEISCTCPKCGHEFIKLA